MSQPDLLPVGIVLPVHNALNHVDLTLEALRLQEPSAPLVVVDDASGPETREFLEWYVGEQRDAGRTHVHLLRNDRQQLFTRTVNRGLRSLYHRYPELKALVACNSDNELLPGWLGYLVRPMFQRPGVALIGYPDQPTGKGKTGRLYEPVELPQYVTGHLVAFNALFLEQHGVLCETDVTGRDSPELAAFHGQAHIGSDRLISWRANEAGWDVLECHFPGVRHAAGKSWNHDLQWLANFQLQPLWPATDTLDEVYPGE